MSFVEEFENELGSNEDLDSQLFVMVQDLDLSKPPSFPFTDSNFKTNYESLLGKNFDKNENIVKKVTGWKRLTDIAPKAQLFLDGAEPGDVVQGEIGDQVIGQTRFTLRFFKDGRWKHVTIDNYLPVDSNNQLIFAKCKDVNEFWVPLAEKAYAKLHGSYKAIDVGWSHDALVDLTGGVGYRVLINSNDYQKQDLWSIIMDCNKEDFLMGTMMKKGDNNSGLLPEHAYALLKAVIVDKYRLIQLRNPWGKTEWNGDWSDHSSKWDLISSAEKVRIGFTIEDDGTFFISYEDFCKSFTSLEICRLFFKEKYLKQIFQGKFDKNVNMTYKNPKDCPQYLLKMEKKAYVYISLLQSDKRMSSNKNEEQLCFGIRVYPNINGKIETGTNEIIHQCPMFIWERETKLEMELDVGEYTIVPALYKEFPATSKFWIRVYSESFYSLSQLNPKPDEKDEIYNYYIDLNDTIQDEFLSNTKKNFGQDFRSYRSLLEQKLSKGNLKGNTDIHFSNNDKTLTHTSKLDKPETVYGKSIFLTGIHYFTVKIEQTKIPSNLMIGVADTSLHRKNDTYLSHGPRGWGYYSYDGSSYHKFYGKNYGEIYGSGDTVGVLLDLDKGELSFYLNGKSLGTAYTGIQGPVSPGFTLYNYGDEITIDYNAKLPDNKLKTDFKEGDYVYIKSKYEKYLTLDWKGESSFNKRLINNAVFTISYEKDYIKFTNSNGHILTNESGSTLFILTELNNYYGLKSKENGSFLGIAHDGTIKSYANSASNDTKWSFIKLQDNPIYTLFQENQEIIMRTYFHSFISCTKEGNLYLSDTPKDESILYLEREKEFFKIRSIYGNYISIIPKHYLFFITQHGRGYSLQSKEAFFGVTKENNISLYDSPNDFLTRVVIETVESTKYLLNGNKVFIKSKSCNTYLRMNEKGEITVSKEKCYFVVIKEGKNFKFKSLEFGKTISTSNSDSFFLVGNNQEYSLLSQGNYLAVSKEIIKTCSKDDGNETRFIFEI